MSERNQCNNTKVTLPWEGSDCENEADPDDEFRVAGERL